VTITVADANGVPVADAKVFATWSYGSGVNCTTDLNGQCTLVSVEVNMDQVTSISLNVTDITHPEPLVYAYQAASNADPDGDSNGTTITADQPVPTAMAVADLDQVITTNGTKWRTTVTINVADANGNPVADAKVFATWSYGSGVNCTTDLNGQCTLASNEVTMGQVTSISLSVDDITHPEPLLYVYQATGNGDPDGDSDGTTIVV